MYVFVYDTNEYLSYKILDVNLKSENRIIMNNVWFCIPISKSNQPSPIKKKFKVQYVPQPQTNIYSGLLWSNILQLNYPKLIALSKPIMQVIF